MSFTFALDCTNGNFTAALFKKDILLQTVNEYPFKEAAEYSAVWIHETLQAHDLSAKDITTYISVAGPGGFSGVRTGTSMISAMALVHNAKIVTLSSLEALALSREDINNDALIVSCLNAKRNGVYIGLYSYNGDKMQHHIAEQLVDKSQLDIFCNENIQHNNIILAGHGTDIIKPYLAEHNIIQEIATSDAALFGKNNHYIQNDRMHAPIYLRHADAAIGKKKFDVPQIKSL